MRSTASPNLGGADLSPELTIAVVDLLRDTLARADRYGAPNCQPIADPSPRRASAALQPQSVQHMLVSAETVHGVAHVPPHPEPPGLEHPGRPLNPTYLKVAPLLTSMAPL